MIPRFIQSLCLALAGLYLVLISVATFCASSHDLRPVANHSHSQNNVSHSLLCTWACQVGSKANAADMNQRALISLPLLLVGFLFLNTLIPTEATLTPTSARGPPK